MEKKKQSSKKLFWTLSIASLAILLAVTCIISSRKSSEEVVQNQNPEDKQTEDVTAVPNEMNGESIIDVPVEEREAKYGHEITRPNTFRPIDTSYQPNRNSTDEPVNLTLGYDKPKRPQQTTEPNDGITSEEGNLLMPFDLAYPEIFASGEVAYDAKTLQVKIVNGKDVTEVLKGTGVEKSEEMFSVSSGTWYECFVKEDADIAAVLSEVRSRDGVAVAEYNFVWDQTESIVDATELTKKIEGLSDNARVNEQWYLRSCGIQDMWEYQVDNNLRVAGEGTVVAVIDTGVDYSHEDLRSNMWINHNEIPDNGVDDDNNGYVDDYYGVDIVNNHGSGNDDNGHGTHVAGIIASVNNKTGVLGVAYNSKIMTIKAGNASGAFLQSDIAKAVRYAMLNGADVINMSFGGAASSMAVQDALELAYTNCVLVAAAGNSKSVNEYTSASRAVMNTEEPKPSYPAALTYVLGVMSVGSDGKESNFTNFDGREGSKTEYEVYAPGEDMLSTLPNNRYASWSGTSMSTPFISAIAAMLRADFEDRSIYPTKYIYGQIVSTGEIKATCYNEDKHHTHSLPFIVNGYNALTKMPTPEVSVQDYTLFDTAGYAEKNNGDGTIDSGETFAIGFELFNRWGVGKDTTVTISAFSQADMANPYVSFADSLNGTYGTSASINYGRIGTYSTLDAGKVYDGDLWTGWKIPFYVHVEENTPNDTLIELKVEVETKNGLDENDAKIYSSEAKYYLNVRNGYVLPSIIDTDQTWTKDNYYIVPNTVYIAEGVTVNVEPGTQIQFWSNDPNDAYASSALAALHVEGELNLIGTVDEHISLFPSNLMDKYAVQMYGNINLAYCDVVNPFLTDTVQVQRVNSIQHCTFTQNYKGTIGVRTYGSDAPAWNPCFIMATEPITDSVFYRLGSTISIEATLVCDSTLVHCAFIDCSINAMWNPNRFIGCLFYGNNNYLNDEYGAGINLYALRGNLRDIFTKRIVRNEETGKTYLLLGVNKYYTDEGGSLNRKWVTTFEEVDDMLQEFGGEVATIETEEEYAFLKKNVFDTVEELIFYGYVLVDEKGQAKDVHGNPLEITDAALSKGTYLHCTGPINYDYENYYDSFANVNAGYIEDLGNNYVYVLCEMPGEIYVNEIGLKNSNVDIDLSMVYQIIADPYPYNGKPLVYESLNEAVATVDSNGFVTPHSTGSAVIRVYSDDKAVYSDLNVNVVDGIDLTGINLKLATTRMNAGETQDIQVELTPANTTKRNLDYLSSDTSVATVDEKGRITALTPGKATITVSSRENPAIKAEAEIEVVRNISTIQFSASMYYTTLEKDDGTEFYPAITPANYTEELKWESSNPEIAYVNEEGKLVKNSRGVTTLLASGEANQVSAQIVVNVSEREDSVNVVKLIQLTDYNNRRCTLTLLDDGTLWVWGGAFKSPRQIQVGFSVKDFAYGSNNTLAVLNEEGTLYEYGAYDLSSDDELHWSEVLKNVTSITSNYKTNGIFFAIRQDASVWAWGGSNMYGEYGNESFEPSSSPVQVSVTDVKQVIPGRYCTLFLRNNGELYFTGGSYTGQSNKPELLKDNVSMVQDTMDFGTSRLYYVSEGVRYFVTADKEPHVDGDAEHDNQLTLYDLSYYVENGEVYVKGAHNNYGELGLGTQYPSGTYERFIRIPGIDNATQIYSNGDTTYIQCADGTLLGTGRNDGYQLADFSTENRYVPQKIYYGLVQNYDTLSVETNNLVEGKLSEKALVLNFNESLVRGRDYGSIVLKDSSANPVSMNKTLRLDQFIVEPLAALNKGETYTLTIPEEALSTMFSVNNSAMEVTFTYDAEEEAEEPTETPAEKVPTKQNEEVTRFYWNEETVDQKEKDYMAHGKNIGFYDNVILNRYTELDPEKYWLRVTAPNTNKYVTYSISKNYWGTTDKRLVNLQIVDFDDYGVLADLVEEPYLMEAPEDVWPFVTRAGLLNAEGEEVSVVGNETVTFYVEFNRDMDTEEDLHVTFGSAYPYADYEVSGIWVSPRRWEGIATIDKLIESGTQYFNISNAFTGDEEHLEFYRDWKRFSFTIDMSMALSLDMYAEATDTGIQLSWQQDDFDTLSGYNVYRSTEEDGYYVKLNKTMIPAEEKTFFDAEVEPGKGYYYNFTVVQTDLSESTPSGKIFIRAKDTMPANIYFTPVYTAYANNNVVLSATVVDNVEVQYAKLYYRIHGTEAWNEVEMSHENDRYYGVIPSHHVTTAGIDYYFAAFDGASFSYAGSENNYYMIEVKEAISDDSLGDVDGDGKITSTDAFMVIRAVNDLLNLTSDQFYRADIDKDGELSSYEALIILKYVSGKISRIEA